jgi:anaerobic selenocysteine-containing dehydrogenase
MVLKEYSPGVVSDITGIPADIIIRLAREFGMAKPAVALGDPVIALTLMTFIALWQYTL